MDNLNVSIKTDVVENILKNNYIFNNIFLPCISFPNSPIVYSNVPSGLGYSTSGLRLMCKTVIPISSLISTLPRCARLQRFISSKEVMWRLVLQSDSWAHHNDSRGQRIPFTSLFINISIRWYRYKLCKDIAIPMVLYIVQVLAWIEPL